MLCRFCVAFGREENDGGKGKETDSVKYLTKFLSWVEMSNLEGQHIKK